MPNAEQLLCQTEKISHRRFSIKILFLNFPIFTGKHLCEIIKNNYFEEHFCTVASELKWFIVWSFVSGSHLKPPWLSNITKIPVVFKRFKQNFAHLLSLYFTSTLSCKPRFCMFITNSYYTKANACSPWTPC